MEEQVWCDLCIRGNLSTLGSELWTFVDPWSLCLALKTLAMCSLVLRKEQIINWQLIDLWFPFCLLDMLAKYILLLALLLCINI